MGKDLEMPDVSKPATTEKTDEKEEKPATDKPIPKPKPSPSELLAADLRRNVGIIEKAVLAKELRLLARVLRTIGTIRKQVLPDVFQKAIDCYLPDSYPSKKLLLECVNEISQSNVSTTVTDMEVDSKEKEDEIMKPKAAPTPNLDALSNISLSNTPEVYAFLHLTIVIILVDCKKIDNAIELSNKLIEYLNKYNRRTMDEINAKSYFYYSRCIELKGKFSTIRNSLLNAYRTATLHNDNATQAVLLNLLLRNYIIYNLYDQADKLLKRTKFPETRSNNQLARYLYYTGRIKAIQLDYNDSLWNFRQALRKAPQNLALGFRISCQKFIIIIQLLIGEIPSRDTFRQVHMVKQLHPYLSLTQAIRIGDMTKFKYVLEACADDFIKDSTYSLIIRLRHNVIKAGLKMLSCSYSKIQLSEICKRLHLDSIENTEGVVAKAILDGVIDAVIDHEERYMKSNETVDVYSTTEPTDAYHARVEFCLNVYNEAIKAMRFPEKKEEEDVAEQRRERFKEQEELAKTLAEEEEDEFEP